MQSDDDVHPILYIYICDNNGNVLTSCYIRYMLTVTLTFYPCVNKYGKFISIIL